MGKVHRVIKFNQNIWLRQYLDMTTDLKKKKKIMLKIFFFKLMNNAVFGKIMNGKCEKTLRY